MKSIFAAIGLIVVVLYLLGACHLGEFRMCYDAVGKCFAEAR